MSNFHTNLLMDYTDDAHQMPWEALLNENTISQLSQTSKHRAESHAPESLMARSPSSVTSSIAISESSSSSSRSNSVSTRSAKPSGSDKLARRRQQNRQSQRAYRDRKEKHQQLLEAEITLWKNKHDKLSKSYNTQSQEVGQLKAQVEKLNSQLLVMQCNLTPESWTTDNQYPPDFTIDPFYEGRASPWQLDNVL